MDVYRRTADLRRGGTPHVLATVVWRRGPSSGRAGAHAVIHADGTMEGWIGGACAEPTVVDEAMEALRDGRPRLLVLGGSDRRPGIVTVAMACESEGVMEVFLEPHVPVPRVVVVGRSPMVDTLVRLTTDLGWRATLIDDGGSRTAHPGLEDVRTSLDLEDVDDRCLIVVATQGHYDEPALEKALATPAAYVGLVASRKRADAVLEHLRGRGITDEGLARIHAPAGVDLGPLEPEEMAVSILAELVGRKAGGLTAGVVVAERETAVDPVCGMSVEPAGAHFTTEHAGRTYYFCAAGCQRAFEADPERYLAG